MADALEMPGRVDDDGWVLDPEDGWRHVSGAGDGTHRDVEKSRFLFGGSVATDTATRGLGDGAADGGQEVWPDSVPSPADTAADAAVAVETEVAAAPDRDDQELADAQQRHPGFRVWRGEGDHMIHAEQRLPLGPDGERPAPDHTEGVALAEAPADAELAEVPAATPEADEDAARQPRPIPVLTDPTRAAEAPATDTGDQASITAHQPDAQTAQSETSVAAVLRQAALAAWAEPYRTGVATAVTQMAELGYDFDEGAAVEGAFQAAANSMVGTEYSEEALRDAGITLTPDMLATAAAAPEVEAEQSADPESAVNPVRLAAIQALLEAYQAARTEIVKNMRRPNGGNGTVNGPLASLLALAQARNNMKESADPAQAHLIEASESITPEEMEAAAMAAVEHARPETEGAATREEIYIDEADVVLVPASNTGDRAAALEAPVVAAEERHEADDTAPEDTAQTEPAAEEAVATEQAVEAPALTSETAPSADTLAWAYFEDLRSEFMPKVAAAIAFALEHNRSVEGREAIERAIDAHQDHLAELAARRRETFRLAHERAADRRQGLADQAREDLLNVEDSQTANRFDVSSAQERLEEARAELEAALAEQKRLAAVHDEHAGAYEKHTFLRDALRSKAARLAYAGSRI